MKLLMMFLLLHTVIIIMAAPAGSNIAQRVSIAGSAVMMTQGTYPDSSSMGSSRNLVGLSSNMLESGSTTSVLATAAGLVTSSESAQLKLLCKLHVRCLVMIAPTGTLVAAPIANDELYNTSMVNNVESSLKVYTVGIILAISFAGIALIIVSVLTRSAGRWTKQISELQQQYTQLVHKNCGQSEIFSPVYSQTPYAHWVA
ncbi:hypothetical protein EDB19DRAFT_702317 [Suillus lakei]|nr:hypothetical protein EDB19DRAFT_702317 [Suillus lakei]